MKNTNQWLSTALIATTLLAGAYAHADEQVTPWLNVGGDINLDASGKSTNDYEANMKIEANLRFELILHEGVKAVIRARIEQELMQNGKGMDDFQRVELEKAIEQAYIQIETDKLTGGPRAVIMLGKGEMAFGQDVLQLPMFRDSLLYKMAREREVIGITVELPVNFLQVIDSLAVSLYESTAGDFKIGDGRGVAVQMSKRLSNQIQAQVSALFKDQNGFGTTEKRGSFGFVFNSDDGTYKVWTQGLVFDGNTSMPNTDYGAQVGGSMKLGPGDIVVDYQYLQKNAQEISLAYNLPVSSWLVISPQVTRHIDETSAQADSTRVGVRARVSLDQAAKRALKTRP